MVFAFGNGIAFSNIIFAYFCLTVIIWLNTIFVMPHCRVPEHLGQDFEIETLISRKKVGKPENSEIKSIIKLKSHEVEKVESTEQFGLTSFLGSPIYITNCIFFFMGSLRIYWAVAIGSGYHF